MSFFMRKSKRTKPVDAWLEGLGLYRKNVAYDETSLFRAISEQTFESQVFHEKVRKECVEYAEKNFGEFRYLVENERKWAEHLDLLRKHMVVCGEIEIQIISKKYKRDITIYDGSNKQVIEATRGRFSDKFLLCLTDQDHYDVVYKKDYIEDSGFCQSIVYKVLYEEVFKIKNVDEIVSTMLHESCSISPTIIASNDSNNNKDEIGSTSFASDLGWKEENNNKNDKIVATTSSCNMAPFPFKVAKALDPNIYRNIEYDSWGELRKEFRLGDWYHGDDKLTLGTKCIYKDHQNKTEHDCYIQQILREENKCVVYLTLSAEKKTVKYSDLSPESDAKPWPLPYRFSKNLTISSQHQAPTLRKTTKNGYREMWRSKSYSEEISVENRSSSIASSELTSEHISSYAGIPLQKRKTHTPVCEMPATMAPESNIQHDVLLTPMTPVTPDCHSRFQWEQQTSQWGYCMAPTANPFIWIPVPQSPQNFNYARPMTASAPPTPNIISYQADVWQQQCVNYGPNYDHYQKQNVETEPCKSPQVFESNECKQSEIYAEQSCGTPERLTLATNLTPISTPVELYSPVVAYPSYTPEIMNQMSMYAVRQPPTSPHTWGYPPGVTMQGFYFPPPPQQQQQ